MTDNQTPIMNLKKDNPVDFLVVGAAKSGTTTLYETLNKHPGIYIPQNKECRYFSDASGEFAGPGPQYANNVTRTLDEYQRLFKKAKPDQLCGDMSPDYLYYYRSAVPKILNEKDSSVPIVIILRNPIDRAYSSYLYHIRDGREDLNFEDALDAETDRRRANWPWGWSYLDGGMYAQQVKAYTDNFERVLLLLFERDVVSGQATEKILRFLNLDMAPEVPNNVHVNKSGYPRSRLFHKFITRVLMDELIVRKIKNLVKMTPFYAGSRRIYRRLIEVNLKAEPMSVATRRMLRERYQNDVALLSEQTGLPLQEYWTDFRAER